MNVKSANPNTTAAARYEKQAIAREGEDSNRGKRPQLHVVSDRVVISHKTRAALAEMREMPDVDLTIRALMNAAPLTERRAVEVLRRIHQGYYKQPEVLQRMATMLSHALQD